MLYRSDTNLPAAMMLLLIAGAIPICASAAHAANGVMLDVVVHEVVASDPPETGVVDSISYPVYFDRKTTLRAGNFVADVTARRGDGESVHLSASLFVSGQLPGNFSDEANVLPGAALIIDNIRGKGKSTYRARLVPRLTELPPDTALFFADSLAWETIYSLRANYHLPKQVFPPMQFLPIRGALDFEFESLLDTLDIQPSDRLQVYLTPAGVMDWPSEPGSAHAIDQSRYRMITSHAPFSPVIRVQPLAIAAFLRHWGYAPQLLMTGLASYADFGDYDVTKDRDAGRVIPLDSLARTADYRCHDRAAADHHAASFVAWLLNTYGIPHFKTLYERATDLSIHRAIWSVYGKTLAELEKDWGAYLKTRTFHRDEFEYYAQRAEVYRDYATELELYQKAADAVNPPTPEILSRIGLVLGQMGRWEEAANAFARLRAEYPDDPNGRWLEAEARRAMGDEITASRLYTEMCAVNPSDPQPYLRLGDIQWEARRVDSAAYLWRHGISLGTARRAGGELRLRMGWYFSERRKGQDSARVYFADARYTVEQLIQANPLDPAALTIAAEAMLGLDSIETALRYLRAAALASNAPVDLGRIHRLRGQCYDKMGRRSEAISEYEAVLACGAEAPQVRLARKYLNRAFGR